MNVAIVGRGRVGRALAKALEGTIHRPSLHRGSAPKKRTATDLPPDDADALVLAVPDAAIAATAARLDGCAPHAVRLHCSGSVPYTALGEGPGARGAMHPLVSFPHPRSAPSLAGATFVIAGEPRAKRTAAAIARAIGARPLLKEIHGPTYHAAAALAANGAAAVADVAVRVLVAEGLARRDAERAIGALLRSVAENVEHVGVPHALSGPIVRGDAGTVRAHRAALRDSDPSAADAYDALAPIILDCARRAGLGEGKAEELAAVLGRTRRRRS
ncbi:MAG: DUF2520 domain-containing protein [Sandaracinaceae bacterium]